MIGGSELVIHAPGLWQRREQESVSLWVRVSERPKSFHHPTYIAARVTRGRGLIEALPKLDHDIGADQPDEVAAVADVLVERGRPDADSQRDRLHREALETLGFDDPAAGTDDVVH